VGRKTHEMVAALDYFQNFLYLLVFLAICVKKRVGPIRPTPVRVRVKNLARQYLYVDGK
jgi:hypothetical protein